MTVNIPPHLESTRQMLSASLKLRPSEVAPAVPFGLLDDLNQRFSTRRIVFEPVRRFSFFDQLRSIIATPTFGMAAAFLLVLAIAAPSLRTSSSTETFRGNRQGVSTPVQIVLIDGPASIASVLDSSGAFEPDSLVTAGSFDEALEMAGPKVILDFTTATIRSYGSDGKEIESSSMPENLGDLSFEVAAAVSRL